ncbi:hypothetical protein BQ8794_70055 [Mesorhizobium prunaredense]|uniref:Uncharacterized protein n=1 Tax=Mesorhizobium prunaredense TaxID=1631249 RepID=A0A1R3VGS4_9HYPH|nr:hypothetical protein BQ8794_70055 [Mesorhizobium prunaredense]
MNADDDHFAAIRHLAGQTGDVDLMRDKHGGSTETLPAEPGQKGSGAHFCGRTVAKERIEQLKRHDVADPEQASGIQATAPLARIDGCRRDAIRTEQVADRAGLRTTLFRQIPLGAAITEPEARRIAGAWGCGMAQHGNGFSGSQGCSEWLGGVCLAEGSRSERQDQKLPTSNSHLASHLSDSGFGSDSSFGECRQLLQAGSLVLAMPGRSARPRSAKCRTWWYIHRSGA